MQEVFGPEVLRQGGVLMAPLLLLSIAVVAAGVNRLQYWLDWRRQGQTRLDDLKASLQGLSPEESERQLNQGLRRLDRQFSRWEPSLDLAMVLGPLLGLLSTVLGLMRLLQRLGPELLLPRGESLISDYGQILVGTALGLVIAVVALVVQRMNRMQRRSVITGLREACQSR